jgi:hypothetical protein
MSKDNKDKPINYFYFMFLGLVLGQLIAFVVS